MTGSAREVIAQACHALDRHGQFVPWDDASADTRNYWRENSSVIISALKRNQILLIQVDDQFVKSLVEKMAEVARTEILRLSNGVLQNTAKDVCKAMLSAARQQEAQDDG